MPLRAGIGSRPGPRAPSPQIATRAAPRSAARIEHRHKCAGTRCGCRAVESARNRADRRPQRREYRVQPSHDRIVAPVGIAPEIAPSTAALSAISPTHSNGLCSRKPHNSAKPFGLASSASISRPKISIRRSFATNGANARNTNRHFGQLQHHCRPRSAADWRNAVLQLRKLPKYCGYREKRRAISISDNGRSSEK